MVIATEKPPVIKQPKRLTFGAYPYPSDDAPVTEWVAWGNNMMGDVWADIEQEIEPLLSAPIEKFNPKFVPTFAQLQGWGRLEGGEWDQIKADDLPSAVVLDIESIRYEVANDGAWLPCLCICYGNDHSWYAWQNQNPIHAYKTNGTRTIEFPTGRIIIGQNAAEHDAQFLTCEYLPLGPEKCIYLDTRAMAALVRGVPEAQRATWEKFKGTRDTKPGPPWTTLSSDLNLEDLTRDLLGIEINKSVNGYHPNNVPPPKTLFEYCAQDVWATAKIFQELWPLVKRVYTPSPVIWWGMCAVTGLRYTTGDWGKVISQMTELYEAAKAIKPALRDDEQKALVTWGKSHLRNLSEGFDINGMVSLRFNPSRDSDGAFQSTVWSQPDFIRQMLMIGAPDAPGTNGYVFETVRVPTPQVPSNSQANSLATQPLIKTLFARCPGSYEHKKAKANWLQQRPLIDMAYLMIGLLDCFCLDRDIDAFLIMPDLELMAWGVKDENQELFNRAVTSAQEVALKIMGAWLQ